MSRWAGTAVFILQIRFYFDRPEYFQGILLTHCQRQGRSPDPEQFYPVDAICGSAVSFPLEENSCFDQAIQAPIQVAFLAMYEQVHIAALPEFKEKFQNGLRSGTHQCFEQFDRLVKRPFFFWTYRDLCFISVHSAKYIGGNVCCFHLSI